jgi:hypothetical protein
MGHAVLGPGDVGPARQAPRPARTGRTSELNFITGQSIKLWNSLADASLLL